MEKVKATRIFDVYKKQRNNTILNKHRVKHLSNLNSNNRDNSRKMFKALNHALHRKVAPPLPPHDDDTELANRFSDFFDEKISKIRSELDSDSSIHSDETYTFNSSKLGKFREMTETEVKKILNNIQSGSNANLACINEFLPIVADIINLSLTQGDLPPFPPHSHSLSMLSPSNDF